MNIKRIAKGKIQDESADKEFENVIKQNEEQFNKILNQLNVYKMRGIKKTTVIDIDKATLQDIINFLGTFINDLKEILK